MSGTISAEFPGLMRQRGGVLTASDAGSSDYFGSACSLSADGSVLAVGARCWDGYTDQGAVYIYDRSGSSWVQRGGVLTASDAGSSDYFGGSCSLSADGQILAVGAHCWDGAYTDQGAVYIYDRSGSSWVQRGGVLRASASDASPSDYFGSACSLSADGSVLAVGARCWDGYTDQGRVHIFDWNGSSWVQRGILTATSPLSLEYFGMSCSLSADGSVLAVGGSDWNNNSLSLTSQGRVHIFDWNGSEWMQRSILNSPYILVGGDRFGHSCSLSADGQILAVGAAAYSRIGWVQIYDRNGSSWVQRGGVLTASDASPADYFGGSCSLSADGQILAVGAYCWDGAYTDQGAVYFYDVFDRTTEVSLKQMSSLFSRATDIFENEKNLIELESIRGGEFYSKLCFRPNDIDLRRRFIRSPEIFSALNLIDKRNQRQDGFRTSQDHQDGGAFTIVGKVVKEGVPGQFIVKLFDRFGARCIRNVLSNPDGSFEFRFLRNNSDGYFLTAIDHTETNLGSGILDSPPLFHKTVEIPPYTSKQILNIGGCTNTVPVDPDNSAGKIEGVVKLNDQLTGADLYLVDLNVCSTVKSSSSDGKYGFYDDGSHSVIPESDKLVVICHYGPDSRPLAHGFVTPQT